VLADAADDGVELGQELRLELLGLDADQVLDQLAVGQADGGEGQVGGVRLGLERAQGEQAVYGDGRDQGVDVDDVCIDGCAFPVRTTPAGWPGRVLNCA
jgi:hypothetical protein